MGHSSHDPSVLEDGTAAHALHDAAGGIQQPLVRDAEHNACPHGESAPQVLARNLAALQPVLDAGEDAVCVIHGGVTAGLLMHWFGGIRYDYPVAPGTGYQVTFEGGKPVSYRPVP